MEAAVLQCGGILCDGTAGQHPDDLFDDSIVELRRETRKRPERPKMKLNCVANRVSMSPEADDVSVTDQQGLSWRLDSVISHSDWTILVIREDVTTYNVHKSVLAVGPRKSTYFARLFQDPKARAVTSLHDFTDLEALAMAVLLDFAYTGVLNITTDKAAALHSLSRRFEMKALRNKTQQFWMEDLNTETVPTYYRHAKLLQESQMLKSLALYCAQNVVILLEMEVDIDFILSVVDMVETATDELSLVVAIFCKQNEKLMNKSVFYRLTAPLQQHMDPKAATALLHVQQSLKVSPKDGSTITKQRDFTLRCIEVLARHWHQDHSVLTLLPSGQLQERYLQLSLEHARQDYNRLTDRCDELEARNDDLVARLRQKVPPSAMGSKLLTAVADKFPAYACMGDRRNSGR